MTADSTPARLHPATSLTALVAALRRRDWRPATPTDRYSVAAGVQWWEPLRPARQGHTPARLVLAGDVVALSTFDREGTPMEQVQWSWVDPGNLGRVHAYVTDALAEALTVRGEI